MGSTPPIATPPRGTGRATLPLVGAVNLLPAKLAVALVALAAVLTGCGGGGTDSTSAASSTSSSGGSAAQSSDAVTIKNYEYSPETISVPVGTVLKITNKDTTPHTVTSKEAGVFESGPIDTNKTGTIKLTKAGTFTYYCAFHPFMHGTIKVE